MSICHSGICSRCNSTYVGMKNRHIRTRACEHMSISSLIEANVKTASVVHDNFSLIDYTISFNDFFIIHSVPNRHSLIIHEHLFIKSHKPNLNAQLESSNFHLC